MADVMLGFTRKEGETFRDCVERYASAYGLEEECLAVYRKEVAAGADEAQAAWMALYEWDVLDLMEEPDGEEADDLGIR